MMVFFFELIPFLFELLVLSLDPGIEFFLLVSGNLGRNSVFFSFFFLFCDWDLQLNFGCFMLFFNTLE